MKKVKILNLSGLAGPHRSWAADFTHRDYGNIAKEGRPVVESRLADLLNDGWQIEGSGGEGLHGSFVILVRETRN